MSIRQPLTAERLGEVLAYEPDTGIFRWRIRPSNRVKVGAVAGRSNGNGYTRICIDGVNHYAHRLAWLAVHGKHPAGEVDHRNGNRADNRIANLRVGTHAQNAQNQPLRVTNTSGRDGVSWSKPHGKWAAYIVKAGRKKHLGLFECIDRASEAYMAAKAKLHAFQPVPRDAVHA